MLVPLNKDLLLLCFVIAREGLHCFDYLRGCRQTRSSKFEFDWELFEELSRTGIALLFWRFKSLSACQNKKLVFPLKSGLLCVFFEEWEQNVQKQSMMMMTEHTNTHYYSGPRPLFSESVPIPIFLKKKGEALLFFSWFPFVLQAFSRKVRKNDGRRRRRERRRQIACLPEKTHFVDHTLRRTELG